MLFVLSSLVRFWQVWPIGCAGCSFLGLDWQSNLHGIIGIKVLGSNFLAGQGM